MIRLRMFHPGRHVWRVRKRHENEVLLETWISLRLRPPNWLKIFTSTLDLIWLPNTAEPGQIQFSEQHGSIAWHEGHWITKIGIRIEGFSAPKKTLIAAALLKAARFYRLEE